ncbi:IS3 family transposase [Nitrosococcus watsonii]|uniref:Integrase catalytic domain-containing protein n=1 Tax=Nitrosococcus watsoni (strain C-113) TaxID=105559 RepID=D8K9U7_NITWC|nr:hypothetical protein Nwat_2509 [Nitrosococcus watsonii C-113]
MLLGECLCRELFNTLKTKPTHHQRYLTRVEAQQETFEYLEAFYNRQRCYSAAIIRPQWTMKNNAEK